jgi:hypothetical protein
MREKFLAFADDEDVPHKAYDIKQHSRPRAKKHIACANAYDRKYLHCDKRFLCLALI